MNALVTGGGGFLGSRIVDLLLARGDRVRTLARGEYPELIRRGVEVHRGDLRDAGAVERAVQGVDTVFHVASKTGYWGSRADFHTTNVDGTRGLLEASRRHGVQRLIYTSTPSVIGYAHEVEGVAEAPYPATHESFYGASKAAAEQLVLASHGPDLATVALRPHLVIGPGDQHLLPRVVARARAGRLRVVGDGRNLVDLTFVDNAAWAHLDAAAALPGPAGGRAYFISNGEPVALWPWTNEVLTALGVPPVTRALGLTTATRLGAILEAAWSTLPLPGEPPMTRFLALALARSHWYDIGPAKRDIGYAPRIGMAEATRATIEDLRRRHL